MQTFSRYSGRLRELRTTVQSRAVEDSDNALYQGTLQFEADEYTAAAIFSSDTVVE
jgi:hypothetical protein